MTSASEAGQVTGTKDKDYNLVWFTEQCLDNALRLESYIEDAKRDGDNAVVELFQKAQADSRKGAEMAKQLLAQRLA
jgi:hypothetical protein